MLGEEFWSSWVGPRDGTHAGLRGLPRGLPASLTACRRRREEERRDTVVEEGKGEAPTKKGELRLFNSLGGTPDLLD